MNEPLETLWYTNSPAPTGLGIAAQTGRLAEAFRATGTSIQDLRGSGEREVRQAHFNQHLTNSVRHGSSGKVVGSGRAIMSDSNTRA